MLMGKRKPLVVHSFGEPAGRRAKNATNATNHVKERARVAEGIWEWKRVITAM